MKNDITGMTDIMQTVSVLRSAKNFFFFVSLLSLLVLGGIFVLSRAGMISYPWDEQIKTSDNNNYHHDENNNAKPLTALAAVVDNDSEQENDQNGDDDTANETTSDYDQTEVEPEEVKYPQQSEEQIKDTDGIEQRAAEAAAEAVIELPEEPNEEQTEYAKPDQTEPSMRSKLRIGEFNLRWATVAAIIKLCNVLVVFSLTIYCLTLLICVKITIVGRLSGAAHITTAMFLSMIAAVLFMPWQAAFPAVGLYGAMYLPYEFASSIIDYNQSLYCDMAMFYARYAGLWLLVVLFLIMAQGRSMCWARGFSRRAE